MKSVYGMASSSGMLPFVLWACVRGMSVPG